MNIETLQIQKEETEEEIKELHSIADNIEILQEQNPIGLGNQKLEGFIKEINKELEWSEVILQEINDSIEFVTER